jgi:hypothetical protein
MTLESTDIQALDMFSCPSALLVTWGRCVRFHDPSSSKREVDWVESYEDVSRDVLWPAANGSNASHSQSLEGKIKLPKDLTSTSSIGRFTILVCLRCFLGTIVNSLAYSASTLWI